MSSASKNRRPDYDKNPLAFFRMTIRGHKNNGYPVCQEWLDDRELGARTLLAEIGPRPSLKHSVDRICTYSPLEPGNVRWATQRIQVNNRRAKSLNGFHAGIHIIKYNMERAARRANVSS